MGRRKSVVQPTPPISKEKEAARIMGLLVDRIKNGTSAILPILSLYKCNMLESSPTDQNIKMVPGLVIRGKVNYDRSRAAKAQAVEQNFARYFMELVKREIHGCNSDCELVAALKAAGFRKVRVEVVDTARRGGSAGSSKPQLLTENLLS